jgi:hypothetical protein
MSENENTASLGRKIFFLYPSSITQNQIISELAQEEFEVYALNDEARLRRALRNYPDSIVFASINEVLKESAWEELIRNIMNNPETSQVDVGVIASGVNESIRRKYTEEIRVLCGYTSNKSDFSTAIKQIIINLNNVNARGRRKHIRMITDNETNTMINLPIHGTFVNGVIKDISVVGFSCAFADDPHLAKNSLIEDIQLRLQSQLIKAEGIVFGSRIDGNEKVYVILFGQRVDPDVQMKVRKYIQSNLQSRMDKELKSTIGD